MNKQFGQLINLKIDDACGEGSFELSGYFLCESDDCMLLFDESHAKGAGQGADVLRQICNEEPTVDELGDFVWEIIRGTDHEYLYDEAIIHLMRTPDGLNWMTPAGCITLIS